MSTAIQPYLVIGTPCYGRLVTDLYAASLVKLVLACQQRDIRIGVQMAGSDALITRARQNIVANFLGMRQQPTCFSSMPTSGLNPNRSSA